MMYLNISLGIISIKYFKLFVIFKILTLEFFKMIDIIKCLIRHF